MDNYREALLAAFQEAADREFAWVPAEEESGHEFSPQFCRQMEKLLAEQRRGSFRLLSRRRRRTLLIAALLAALLLATCSAAVRGFVGELLFGWSEEGLTDFKGKDGMQAILEDAYGLTWVPVDLEMAAQNDVSLYRRRTVYEGTSGRGIRFTQTAADFTTGHMDYTHGESSPRIINGNQVFIYAAEGKLFAEWIQDGYSFSIYGTGSFTMEEVERMVASVAPAENVE